MDFKSTAIDMLIELGNDYTDERHTELLGALSNALAKALALMPDHDKMHFVMDTMMKAIAYHACVEQREIHGDQEKVIHMNGNLITYEQFLRDVFQPNNTND